MSRAFLIGAGATKAVYADAPLSNDFLKKLHAADEGSSIYRALEETASKEIPANVSRYNDQPFYEFNIEELVTISESFSQSSRNKFLADLYNALYILIADPTESTQQQMEDAIAGRTVQEPHTLFHTLLTDPRLKPDDFFMTLNYDLYLDREVMRTTRSIDYGLPVTGAAKRRGVPLVDSGRYSVYHLHGSLNWVRNAGKLDIYLGAQLPIAMVDGCNLCLAPPGRKDLDATLEAVWGKVKERLQQADELIIIGCSLNCQDSHLMDLVNGFINNKGGQKVKAIYLGDADERNFGRILEHNKRNNGFTLDSIEFIFEPTKY
jgi:hypothetical protein